MKAVDAWIKIRIKSILISKSAEITETIDTIGCSFAEGTTKNEGKRQFNLPIY